MGSPKEKSEVDFNIAIENDKCNLAVIRGGNSSSLTNLSKVYIGVFMITLHFCFSKLNICFTNDIVCDNLFIK